MGQNSFLANAPGAIFITDLGADATAVELNLRIGLSAVKTEFGIQFSQETLLNNGLRAVMSKENIFTIPVGTNLEGTFKVFRK